MESLLENLNVSNITASLSNPRKSFDEKELIELSESIKTHGLLQPILVRPVSGSLDKKGLQNYEIVYGERRFRASKLAQMKTIKAEVRNITDEDAIEIQIIENLVRKDIHPLEEAEAFKKLLDNGKYTISDIAAKMAKSEIFITQRLKLVELIDEIKQDFFDGFIGIGHAILVARCIKEKQETIFKEAQPWRGEGTPDYGTLSDLKETIQNDFIELTKAKFNLDDDTLTCISCSICPKRSGANPILFDDMKDEDICFDEICFNDKTTIFVERETEKIISNGEDVVICSGYDKPTDLLILLCEKFDVKILKQYDDYNTNERAGWELKKGFKISGREKGNYFEIYLKPLENKSRIATDELISGEEKKLSPEQREIEVQISKINERQKRALELDGEKVWNEIRKLNVTKIRDNSEELKQFEKNGLALVMLKEINFNRTRELLNELKLVLDINSIQNVNFTDEQFNIISRNFALDKLPDSFESHLTQTKNYMYKNIVENYYEQEVKGIESTQKEIANSRILKANEKVKVLQNKFDKI